MYSIEQLEKQAVAAFKPSKQVLERLFSQITTRRNQPVSIAFVHRNSEKIMKSVYKRYEKLMGKMAS